MSRHIPGAPAQIVGIPRSPARRLDATVHVPVWQYVDPPRLDRPPELTIARRADYRPPELPPERLLDVAIDLKIDERAGTSRGYVFNRLHRWLSHPEHSAWAA